MLSLVLLDDEARSDASVISRCDRDSEVFKGKERYTAEVVVNCLSSREMSNGAIVVCETAPNKNLRTHEGMGSGVEGRQECSTDIYFASQPHCKVLCYPAIPRSN